MYTQRDGDRSVPATDISASSFHVSHDVVDELLVLTNDLLSHLFLHRSTNAVQTQASKPSTDFTDDRVFHAYKQQRFEHSATEPSLI